MDAYLTLNMYACCFCTYAYLAVLAIPDYVCLAASVHAYLTIPDHVCLAASVHAYRAIPDNVCLAAHVHA